MNGLTLRNPAFLACAASAKSHIVTVETVDDVAGSLNGKYFRLRRADDTLTTIWLNLGGALQPIPGRALEITTVMQDDSAQVIAGAIMSLINNEITVDNEHSFAGYLTAANTMRFVSIQPVTLGAFDEGDAGFTLTLVQQGISA